MSLELTTVSLGSAAADYQLSFTRLTNQIYLSKNEVGPKGFEPMTSALSKQRSKPTELRSHFTNLALNLPIAIADELRSRFVLANIDNPPRVRNPLEGFYLNKTLLQIHSRKVLLLFSQVLRRSGKC